ncbi:CPBP family intramembrane glutamic endopeptidase [Polaribacter porphyrae]|uniref:CAAX protease n=1 Tax=Polaribacter porphyrae TaxID=1137780 RepID=A0A2S7WKH9_9FLAO|nr:CPBP family intramembrane glutamic endopeptidase [Polaribacter porphyrae]PQJ78115.1 CAAX protease [Polaribacter porphyrae]
MKKTFLEFINYIKNPVLESDKNKSLNYRFRVFFKIFIFCIIVGILTTPIFIFIEEMNWVNMDNHKVEAMFKDMALYKIILLGGFFVPLIEELLFRAPITLFKKPKVFKIAFYVFTIIFGLIHITNFDITTNVLLLTPLLVIPQLFVGLSLGFLRVRFGFWWAVLLHCIYNSFFLTISTLS